MGIFLVYMLKSALCLAAFYLFYSLLLSRETFHRFNRFVLLGVLCLSCLLPWVEIRVKPSAEAGDAWVMLEAWMQLVGSAGGPAEVAVPVASTPWWVYGLLWLYVAGIAFFAVRNLYSLGRLAVLLRSGKREDMTPYVPEADTKAVLLVHDRSVAPFSWMKYIVISRKDLQENGREILIHELAHIHARHSLDLLAADVCIFFQWFNPAAWLLKQELQNVHEYEADEAVIHQGIDATQYQLLLIKKAVGTRLYSMANSFNHSKLKKRITMMTKEKSSSWARLKFLYVLPVAVIAVTAFARPEVSAVSREISSAKVNNLVPNSQTNAVSAEDTVIAIAVIDTLLPKELKGKPEKAVVKGGDLYDIVEVMPKFPGGPSEMMKYLAKNIRYPEAAKKAKTQGRVVVQFVVDAEGNVTNPSVIHGVDKELDAEAVRVVSGMPRWTPGMQDGKAVAVRYAVPIMFNLLKTQPGGKGARLGADGKEPLIVVDGKEMTDFDITSLDPSTIESIHVLKDEASIEPYGEKGKNGVILVNLKKGDGK